MLQHSIQSVREVDWNGYGCWNVACTVSWSCLTWMFCCNVASRASSKLVQMDVTILQRSIQSVLELTSRACGKLIDMDVTTKTPASWSCLKEIFFNITRENDSLLEILVLLKLVVKVMLVRSKNYFLPTIFLIELTLLTLLNIQGS